MGWLDNYAASWRVCSVDEATWEDSSDVEGVLSVSVSRSCEDSVSLLEEGGIEVDGDFAGGWHRIYMYADGQREPIATLMFEKTRTSAGGGTVSEASGYSVLKPADDRVMASFPQPYAPAGADGAEWAARIISACTPAPVEAAGGFTLNDAYVFNPGASCLETAWGLLDAGGWCMQVDGGGTVRVMEKPTDYGLVLDSSTVALVTESASIEEDYSGVPNRYFVSDGTDTAMASNEDPESPTGYPARGRWVDAYDESPVLVNGETLGVYARRKLSEESAGVAARVEYKRDYWPGVLPFSLVLGRLPGDGLDGPMRVVSQELECGKGIEITETAVKEVRYL